MNKKELWLNISHYHFEHLVPTHLWDLIAEKFGGHDASTKAFADKLSRKLSWRRNFAMRAVWEYKKFVYLGVIADFNVTPPKLIDQVWHEHLLFSSGYRKFCEEVIQYDFNHSPELVPVADQIETFQAQYADTIELYRKEFGAEPPADIWAATKFDETDAKPGKQSIRKESVYSSTADGSDVPLVSMFSSAESTDFEFGGGEFGGGGASGDWGNSDSHDTSDSGVDSGSDGGSDGGSSCSSGCGGCGGGD